MLPPRPKPGRKPINDKEDGGHDKKRKKSCKKVSEGSSISEGIISRMLNPNLALSQPTDVGLAKPDISMTQGNNLHRNGFRVAKNEKGNLSRDIGTIEGENNQLKTSLLSYINEYKRLKFSVLNRTQSLSPNLFSEDLVTKKGSLNELGSMDSIHELTNNMSDLWYQGGEDKLSSLNESAKGVVYEHGCSNAGLGTTENFLSYLNLDEGFETTFIEDEEENNGTSALSRAISPSPSSDTEGDNFSMASLTRTTTASTSGLLSSSENPVKAKPLHFKFYNLPGFFESPYEFSFDKINPTEEKLSLLQEDKYNMVTDFLEEKFMDNDLSYYVQNESL